MANALVEAIDILIQLAPAQAHPSESWGLFFLIFTFVYLALQYVSAFEGNKGARFIVASIFAYFSAKSSFAVKVVEKLAPRVSIILIAAIAFLFALAILAPNALGILNTFFIILLIGVIFSVVTLSSLSVGPGAGAGGVGSIEEGIRIGGTVIPPDVIGGLILIVIFITFLGWLFSGEEEETIWEKLEDLMSKKV